MAARQGQLDLGEGSYTPKVALSLAEEIAILRKQNVLTPKSWTV